MEKQDQRSQQWHIPRNSQQSIFSYSNSYNPRVNSMNNQLCCEYCSQDVAVSTYFAHLQMCQSKATLCTKCITRIANKDYYVHYLICRSQKDGMGGRPGHSQPQSYKNEANMNRDVKRKKPPFVESFYEDELKVNLGNHLSEHKLASNTVELYRDTVKKQLAEAEETVSKLLDKRSKSIKNYTNTTSCNTTTIESKAGSGKAGNNRSSELATCSNYFSKYAMYKPSSQIIKQYLARQKRADTASNPPKSTKTTKTNSFPQTAAKQPDKQPDKQPQKQPEKQPQKSLQSVSTQTYNRNAPLQQANTNKKDNPEVYPKQPCRQQPQSSQAFLGETNLTTWMKQMQDRNAETLALCNLKNEVQQIVIKQKKLNNLARSKK